MIENYHSIGGAIYDMLHNSDYWIVLDNFILFNDMDVIEGILDFQLKEYYVDKRIGSYYVILSEEQVFYLSLKYQDRVFNNGSIHKMVEKLELVKL